MKPNISVHPVHFEDFDGLNFERLVMAYLINRFPQIKFKWFGKGGHDEGRDIWGVDKNGTTYCYQCTKSTLTKKKILLDIDKVCKAKTGVPDKFIVVSGGNISGRLIEAIEEYTKEKGINECECWLGAQFEEFLRRDSEILLKRFCMGEPFPDTPQKLKYFDKFSVFDSSPKGKYNSNLVETTIDKLSTEGLLPKTINYLLEDLLTEAHKIYNKNKTTEEEVSSIGKLVKFVCQFMSENDNILKSCLRILFFLTKPLNVLNLVKEGCYNQIKTLYTNGRYRPETVKILDAFGDFGDRTSEIIKSAKLRDLPSLNFLIPNLEFSEIESKRIDFINELFRVSESLDQSRDRQIKDKIQNLLVMLRKIG